jgi:hypothetical protein
LQSPWIPEKTGLITSLWQGTKLSIRNSGTSQDRPSLQMRTITYNDETASCSWSNHLMGTRLLPSSDDSDNIFSRTPLGTLGLR